MESWSKKIGGRIIRIPELFSNVGIYTVVALGLMLTILILDLYLCYFVTSFPYGTILPISSNTTEDPCYVSPFCHINVKNLMLDPPDFYVHKVCSTLFVNWLDLANSYQFITPNMMSYFHVLVALTASKLITNDSICIRRIGVLLFQFRNFLDEVDGIVAIKRRHSKMVSLSSSSTTNLGMFNNLTYSTTINGDTFITSDSSPYIQQEMMELKYAENIGYWVDGICDGLGGIFLYLACYFHLQKHPVRRRSLFAYVSLPLVVTSRNGSSVSPTTNNVSILNNKDKKIISRSTSPTNTWSRQLIRTIHRSGVLAINYGFQALFSSIAWNRFILNYINILENNNPHYNINSLSSHEKHLKSDLLRSPCMWFVFLAWRYVNPHTWIEILLLAVFFDRIEELVYAFRMRGYIIIFLVIAFTEAHFQYVQTLK